MNKLISSVGLNFFIDLYDIRNILQLNPGYVVKFSSRSTNSFVDGLAKSGSDSSPDRIVWGDAWLGCSSLFSFALLVFLFLFGLRLSGSCCPASCWVLCLCFHLFFWLFLFDLLLTLYKIYAVKKIKNKKKIYDGFHKHIYLSCVLFDISKTHRLASPLTGQKIFNFNFFVFKKKELLGETGRNIKQPGPAQGWCTKCNRPGPQLFLFIKVFVVLSFTVLGT